MDNCCLTGYRRERDTCILVLVVGRTLLCTQWLVSLPPIRGADACLASSAIHRKCLDYDTQHDYAEVVLWKSQWIRDEGAVESAAR